MQYGKDTKNVKKHAAMRVIFMPKRDMAQKGARTVTPKTMDYRATL